MFTSAKVVATTAHWRNLHAMKIAIISDIHANAVALARVLEATRKDHVDLTVCLGDVASDGPQPTEVISLLRDLDGPFIMGNADAQLLGLEPEIADPALTPFIEASRWCSSKLSSDDLAFLNNFEPVNRTIWSELSVLLCHGSPLSFNDEIYPSTTDDVLRGYLEKQDAQLYIGGHTHYQMFRRIDQSTFVNPGSVGMAYDRTRLSPGQIMFGSWAEYAVLTIENGSVDISFRKQHFDCRALIQAIHSSGMPQSDWWAAAWSFAALL